MVQPLALMVKHMDTFIADRTVFGPGGCDGYIAKVALANFYHMAVFAFVLYKARRLGSDGSRSIEVRWVM